MTTDSEIVAQRAEARAYFAELSAVLTEGGVEESWLERAIGHLEHGLQDRWSPLRYYGPVDQLADALIEVRSTRHQYRWRAVGFLGMSALYFLATALLSLRLPPIGAVSTPGDLTFPGMMAAHAVVLPMAFAMAGFGGGYLVRRAKFGFRVNEGFGLRPVHFGRYFLGFALGLVVTVVVSLVLRVVAPPNAGGMNYFVSTGTVWLILGLSVFTSAVCWGSFLGYRRVPIAGDARYLLRDSEDMLRTAPWGSSATGGRH